MFRMTVGFNRYSEKTEDQAYSVDFRLIQNLLLSITLGKYVKPTDFYHG